MHEHAHPLVGHDDERVREDLQQRALDRRDDVDDLERRLDRDARTHRPLGEQLIGYVGERQDDSDERGQDDGHGDSSGAAVRRYAPATVA